MTAIYRRMLTCQDCRIAFCRISLWESLIDQEQQWSVKDGKSLSIPQLMVYFNDPPIHYPKLRHLWFAVHHMGWFLRCARQTEETPWTVNGKRLFFRVHDVALAE